jgi:hypothetical protein
MEKEAERKRFVVVGTVGLVARGRCNEGECPTPDSADYILVGVSMLST